LDSKAQLAVVAGSAVRHLLTIPGVGLTTAASLFAVVGEVTRFPRPAKLASYLGLDPRVRQSGAGVDQLSWTA